MNPMFQRSLLSIGIACLLVFLCACADSKSSLKSLFKDVEAYHKDLIFERYEIAAKRISPESRGDWLEAILSQHLKFSEIEIVSSQDCTKSTPDAPVCICIISHVQWYANASPVVKTNRLHSVWQFDEEQKTWFLVEQTQL